MKIDEAFIILSFCAFGFSYAEVKPDHANHSKARSKARSTNMSHSPEGHSKRDQGMNSSDKSQSDGNQNINSSDKSSRESLTPAVRESVISVLEVNSDLHRAFFDYNGQSVEEKAVQLREAIEAISDEEISKLLSFSKVKLSEIKAENTRKTNNKNYHLVSMALIYIINKYDLGSKYNAYSCPMLKKKWIQNSETMPKLHNPYASTMPHCGSQDSHY